jgi:hypothetical protein
MRQSDAADQRGALKRRILDVLESMTGVLQYVGFGRREAPTVPRAQESEYEAGSEAPDARQSQTHPPAAERLERGHPKR